MNPQPMIDGGRCWVAQAARAARYGMLALWIAAPVVNAQTNSPTGPAAYRCSNSYSSTPCPGGRAVDTDDARSTEQQRGAQDVKRRDAALADQMAAERGARERATAAQPAVGIGPPTAASAPRRDTAKPATTKQKKNTVKKPPTTASKKLSSSGAGARPGTSGR